MKTCPYCGAAMRDRERDQKIEEMWRTGKTKREIGLVFGVSSTTVKKAIERAEDDARRGVYGMRGKHG